MLSGSFAYEIKGTLGGGATGTVYLAVQTALARQVAIKELSERLANDPGFLDRFRAEAQVMAGLDHPNCVRVYEFIEEPGRHWLVCEYVDGASIDLVEAQAGRLTPEQALGIVKGALTGLAYAHGLGLIHRDIKPANLIADRQGVSKLADFGLAVRATASDAAGVPLGTPAYMSPEQAMGHTLGIPSDVYSCGATLFDLITGRTPYRADTALTMMYKQIHEPVPDPRHSQHGLPEPVSVLLMRALAKDPADRPQGAPEFLAELETAAVAAYGHDWEKRAGIASLVSAAAAGATVASGGVAALAAGAAPAVGATPAVAAAGAGAAGGAGEASAAAAGAPGFSFLGMGAIPLAIVGGVLVVAVLVAGAIAYSMGAFTSAPVALASPSPTPLGSPSAVPSPSPEASPSPSPSPSASPSPSPSPSPTLRRSPSPTPTSSQAFVLPPSGPLTVSNLEVWYQRCPGGVCSGPYDNFANGIQPAFACGMSGDSLKFADQFAYSNQGAGIPITITWQGAYPDGTPDNAVRVDAAPSGSGTHPPTDAQPYDDQQIRSHSASGAHGTIAFHMSWTDPDGTPGNADSPVLTYTCG